MITPTAEVTQVDAAEAMGIRQPYLSSLEGGKFGGSLTHALLLLRCGCCEVREPPWLTGSSRGFMTPRWPC